jgi:hypothetical protein
LLARVNRCKARLELQGDISLSRTEVFWRLLEMGCGLLEVLMSAPEQIPDSLLSEISKEYNIPKISEIPSIAGDQPEQPPPQAPLPPSHLETVEEPEPIATPALPMAVPLAPAVPSPEAAHRNQRGLSRAKLQEIADERTQCQGLPLRDFAQRLYDKGIYRTKDDKPAESGWLSRQLKKVQDEGML